MNSLLHPSELPKGQYAYGENIINRGGIVQTRPGYKKRASIAGIVPQGIGFFKPLNSAGKLLVAVDGRIYVAGWNDFTFMQIAGLEFDLTAPIIRFEPCLQSVKRNLDGTLTVINPIPVLIIQDGVTQAGYWDGTTAKHLVPSGPSYETPTGLWMKWTSSRLWVFNGSIGRVSDEGNPLSFAEDNVLATRSYFVMPGEVTGVVETSNARALLVATAETITGFQSSIRDRTTWQNTPDFQKVILPRVGCVAGKTMINQYGLTHWQSASGFINLDAALNADRTSRMVTNDSEMMRSKRNLAPVMDEACALAFENFIFLSVPSGGKWNEHTWVMDQAPLEEQSATGAWAGIWTGTRPVDWTQGRMGGELRAFFLSYDKTSVDDTHIHVWEAMQIDRRDEDGAIACQFQESITAADHRLNFKYAEFEVMEMLGDVSLQVFVSGTRGPWYQIGDFTLKAKVGSLAKNLTLTTYSIIETYKPHSRSLKTDEFDAKGLECTVEMGEDLPGRDKGFALLFEWRGRMGIREVRTIFAASPVGDRGKCIANETQAVAINESGEQV